MGEVGGAAHPYADNVRALEQSVPNTHTPYGSRGMSVRFLKLSEVPNSNKDGQP
jgi:hypothetical protein